MLNKIKLVLRLLVNYIVLLFINALTLGVSFMWYCKGCVHDCEWCADKIIQDLFTGSVLGFVLFWPLTIVQFLLLASIHKKIEINILKLWSYKNILIGVFLSGLIGLEVSNKIYGNNVEPLLTNIYSFFVFIGIGVVVYSLNFILRKRREQRPKI